MEFKKALSETFISKNPMAKSSAARKLSHLSSLRKKREKEEGFKKGGIFSADNKEKMDKAED